MIKYGPGVDSFKYYKYLYVGKLPESREIASRRNKNFIINKMKTRSPHKRGK